jgi:hypothetical protein
MNTGNIPHYSALIRMCCQYNIQNSLIPQIKLYDADSKHNKLT